MYFAAPHRLLGGREALIFMSEKFAWTKAAHLEYAPFILASRDGIALWASSLVDSPKKTTKRQHSRQIPLFIDGNVQLRGFTFL